MLWQLISIAAALSSILSYLLSLGEKSKMRAKQWVGERRTPPPRRAS
jgi:hypothetical protein